MTKCQVFISFDKEDCIYYLNEEVSGKVVLDVFETMTLRGLDIDYGWRTHGKGDQDKGELETQILLSEATQLRGGERMEYPFRFRISNGPVTYHGHLLNVDWYVSAQDQIYSLKCEQDFILNSRKKSEESIPEHFPWSGSQDTRTSKDHRRGRLSKYKLETWTFFAAVSWIIFSPLILGAFFMLHFHWILSISLFLLSLLAFFGINRLVVPHLRETYWSRNTEVSDIRITPEELYPGSKLTCRLQLQTKRAFYLDAIYATLSAVEIVDYDASGKSTDWHTFYHKSMEKTYSQYLDPGRLVYFECVLPVLPVVPVSFKSENNEIRWNFTLNMTSKWWPAWGKTFPITVLPI